MLPFTAVFFLTLSGSESLWPGHRSLRHFPWVQMLVQQLLDEASFVLEVFLCATKLLFLVEMCEFGDFIAFQLARLFQDL